MGNTNTLPIISQSKSLVQLATGDKEGAKETQEKFFHECPLVAQATSLVEYTIDRDRDRLVDTNKRSVKVISHFADGIPVVGHIKGAVHAATGDKEAAKGAIKSANRSTGVVGGGVVGFLTGGPVGAVAGGIVGGAAMDGIHTGVSSAYHSEFRHDYPIPSDPLTFLFRPSGSIAAVKQAIDAPSGGTVFDAVAVPVFDGVAGFGAGIASSTLAEAATQQEAAVAVLEEGTSGGEAAVIGQGNGGMDINQITDHIRGMDNKLELAKTIMDPQVGFDTIKAIPKSSAKWTTVSTSSVQLQNILEQLRILKQILTTSKDIAIIVTQPQLDKLGPEVAIPFKTILLEIARFIGSSIPRKEQIMERTSDLISRLSSLANRPTSTKRELSPIPDENRDNTLHCVQWNMEGMDASILENLGLVWYLMLDSPDLLLLNNVRASENLMTGLTSVLGYKFLKFPSSSIEHEDSPGSALLFRPRLPLSCVGAGAELTLNHEQRADAEVIWADIQKDDDFVVRLINVSGNPCSIPARELVLSLSEGQSTIVSGCGRHDEWSSQLTTRGFQDASLPSDDYYLLVRFSFPLHIQSHRLQSQKDSSLPHLPLPFSISPSLDPHTDICSDSSCYYGCAP